MRRSFFALALLFTCAGTALAATKAASAASSTKPAAQAPVIYDATQLGSAVPLDRSWRVGVTADPAAATPQFDDSKWAVRSAGDSFDDVTEDPDRPHDADSSKKAEKGDERDDSDQQFAWFRIHVKLPQNHGPIALLIEVPVKLSTAMSFSDVNTKMEVFVDGRQIRPQGPNSSAPERFQPISRLYDLQVSPGQSDLVLAIRTMYIPVGTLSYTHFFSERTLMLGSPTSLSRSVELWRNHGLFEHLPKLVNSILLIVLAAFLLALYFTQRDHREYLWLALFELVQAPISYLDLAGTFAYVETLKYGALFMELLFISAYLYLEFLIAFLNLGHLWARSWKRRIIYLLRLTAPILFSSGPLVYFSVHSHAIGVLLIFVMLGCMFWLLFWLLFCLIVLVTATLRRNFEAGLLLFPLLLTFIGLLEPVFTSGMMDTEGHRYHSPLTLNAGPVPVHFASIADFVGLLVIVVIIFGRFLRIHRERERANSELHAARSVQELMIPQEKVETPGFEVDSVYNPAAEVGGDFFHVHPTPDGGLLVVIGDVAGKGLQAAMNVSMLIGALRSKKGQSPAKILESLNKVLVGSESFTTCQAAWFGPNGELTVASAGHLPPYLNSQEINLPGGLPLGVIPNATYDEINLYLHPGDRVLFLSDGVVEARNASGELFGFDRVHNLSNQSAFYIADAAKEFGQEDDITVLTVRRLATAVAAA